MDLANSASVCFESSLLRKLLQKKKRKKKTLKIKANLVSRQLRNYMREYDLEKNSMMEKNTCDWP